MSTTQIHLEQTGPVRFEAVNATGARTVMDGSPELGGTNSGLRPMETVLAALSSCSSIDIVSILKKQRQPLAGLSVQVNATRADAVPAVFTDIELNFTARGPVDPEKLRLAVELSMEKYCSVSAMLKPKVAIRWTCGVVP